MAQLDLALQAWLERFLAGNEGAAGTVHLRRGELLELAAAVNIPSELAEITATVARGNGMPGLAWERGQPVSTCNLATDTTGDVRPGASAVEAHAAAALPVHDRHGELVAVVGIAWNDERDIDDDALGQLARAAAGLPSAS